MNRPTHFRPALATTLVLALLVLLAATLGPVACGGDTPPLHPDLDDQVAAAALEGQPYIVIVNVHQSQLQKAILAMHELGYELATASNSREAGTGAHLFFRRTAPDPPSPDR